MVELRKLNIKIPDDITITGFDDLRYANALFVPLTTFKIPVNEMVKQTLKLLKEEYKKKKYLFDIELVLRDSHKSLK